MSMKKICIGVLGLAPCHFEKPESKLQVRLHSHAVWSSWPGQTVMGSWPPTEVFRLFKTLYINYPGKRPQTVWGEVKG